MSLFGRDAIDTLVARLKIYADIKIQQVRPSVDAAKPAHEQAEAAERAVGEARTQAIMSGGDYKAAREVDDAAENASLAALQRYTEIVQLQSSYYSGEFYFGFLKSAIQTAETDAEGKFVIEVPRTGTFVIAAQARRSIGDETERYYWLQPISLEGQQQLTQSLSNNNLTSATGTSSLIVTKD